MDTENDLRKQRHQEKHDRASHWYAATGLYVLSASLGLITKWGIDWVVQQPFAAKPAFTHTAVGVSAFLLGMLLKKR